MGPRTIEPKERSVAHGCYPLDACFLAVILGVENAHPAFSFHRPSLCHSRPSGIEQLIRPLSVRSIDRSSVRSIDQPTNWLADRSRSQKSRPPRPNANRKIGDNKRLGNAPCVAHKTQPPKIAALQKLPPRILNTAPTTIIGTSLKRKQPPDRKTGTHVGQFRDETNEPKQTDRRE